MTTKKSKDVDTESAEVGNDERPICGLIMPISATPNHDEKHWAAVQTLLHRGIKLAGMTPSNVWEGLNDRISKRIVSNIFRQDIVVADISDLNPNVMLELGLRLASKKPTVIVFNAGGKIPFDIGDVEAIPYPSNLNILDMEEFFDKFVEILTGRLDAFKSGSYEPYLGDVVVEVIEPQEKGVSIADALLERLEDIGSRIARIEQKNARSLAPGQPPRMDPEGISSYTYYTVPKEYQPSFQDEISRYRVSSEWASIGDKSYFRVGYYSASPATSSSRSRIGRMAENLGGSVGISDHVMRDLPWG